MIKLLFIFLFFFAGQAEAAYQYTYVPKTSSPTIYNFYTVNGKNALSAKSMIIPNRSACALPVRKGQLI